MKKFILSLIASILCSNTCIQAEDYFDYIHSDESKIYAEVFGGANFLQTQTSGGVKSDYQTGYVLSGSLGYRWCYGLRLEAEYAFRKNSARKVHFLGRNFNLHGHFQSSSYMANLLWDLPVYAWGYSFCNIKPFVGAGVGYDFQQIHAKNAGLTLNQSKKDFAWQVIAGLSYPLFCNTDISIEYKFHKGGFSYIYNHSVGLSLTYKFGL